MYKVNIDANGNSNAQHMVWKYENKNRRKNVSIYFQNILCSETFDYRFKKKVALTHGIVAFIFVFKSYIMIKLT